MNYGIKSQQLFENIQVAPDIEGIYRRMGFNKKLTLLTAKDAEIINNQIKQGLSYCHNKGVFGRFKIIEKHVDYVKINNDLNFKSKGIAKLLAASDEIVLMAATSGAEVAKKIFDEVQNGDVTFGVILDAVASQNTDAILDWIMGFLNKVLSREGKKLTKHRYSPGYGDLNLEYQKIIYQLLNLERLDLKLTEKYMLVPEKSVIALAGIERI